MVKANFLTKILKNFFISLIKIYQIILARMLYPNRCRFHPSCSNYAIEAIQKKGLITGIVMTIWRLLRCNPFNKNCGYDPVIKNNKFKKR